MSIIPLDLSEIIRKGFEDSNRPPDGLLHASSHLTGSLRHVQLEVAGAPKVPEPLLSKARVTTGTFWHVYLTELLRAEGTPFMSEVKLAKYMPSGWSGTADWIIWSDEYKGFVLTDLKTTSEKALGFIPKMEHIWQTSLYWHALADGMGIQLVEGIGILYLPLDTKHARRQATNTEFVVAEFAPIPWAKLKKEMVYRKKRVDEYVALIPDVTDPSWKLGKKYIETNGHLLFLNKELEPVQERVQKLSKLGDKYELKLVPHWSTDYCNFPTELCDCSKQGQTKIGEYAKVDGKWAYVARKGYEGIVSEQKPKGR